jgi:hypothetical protein
MELTARRSELWSRISTRTDELQRLLAAIPDDALATTCAAEGWSVAFVGCHISLGLRRQANWVRRVLAGSGPMVFDWERTHSLNALMARRVERPAKAEILRALADGAELWRQLLQRASDDDLERLAFRLGEHVKPIEWVAAVVVPRHIDEHMRSIRSAL